MDYNLYKRTRQSKGKVIKVWYYWYYDGDKQVSKVCSHCTTKLEAENFIKKLTAIDKRKGTVVLKDISYNMYLPASSHMIRRDQMGKSLSPNSIKKSRNFIKYINHQWGNYDFESITVKEVTDYLIKDKICKNRSG